PGCRLVGDRPDRGQLGYLEEAVADQPLGVPGVPFQVGVQEVPLPARGVRLVQQRRPPGNHGLRRRRDEMDERDLEDLGESGAFESGERAVARPDPYHRGPGPNPPPGHLALGETSGQPGLPDPSAYFYPRTRDIHKWEYRTPCGHSHLSMNDWQAPRRCLLGQPPRYRLSRQRGVGGVSMDCRSSVPRLVDRAISW